MCTMIFLIFFPCALLQRPGAVLWLADGRDEATLAFGVVFVNVYISVFVALRPSSRPLIANHSATRKFEVQESQGESLNLQWEWEFDNADAFEHSIVTLPFWAKAIFRALSTAKKHAWL